MSLNKYTIINAIKDAELSLNETEYLAFVIGQYIYCNESAKNNLITKSDFLDLKIFFTCKILQARSISFQALEKKKHIPIKNALGLFFHFEKENAMVIFQSVIKDDFNDTLDRMTNMEHLVYMERLFSRLRLDYIPKLTKNPADLFNPKDVDKFIKKSELKVYLDEFGMFSFTEQEHITRNNPSPIKVTYLLKDDFIAIMKAFFNIKSVAIDKKEFKIFHDFLTSPYSKYKLYEINTASEYIYKLISQDSIEQQFKHLLAKEIPDYINRNIKTKFQEGVSEFFLNKKGFSIDRLKSFNRKNHDNLDLSYTSDKEMIKSLKRLIK